MTKRGISVSLAVLAGVSFGEPCTWNGAWDVTPQEGDAIVIASGDLTWKSPLPMSVASWTQNADYTGTVTFDTGLETFAVTGDVTLNGGKWTHTANPSFKNTDEGWTSGRGTKQLIVSCGGNFTINPGATINVEGKGYTNKQGPGWGEQGRGASHGGSGAHASGRCYGSPVTPVTIGSAGRDGRGGGAIALTVGGTLTVNGHISANSTPVGGGDYHSAGGSVLLVANAMVGASNITASCGHYGPQTSSGGGGRIALKLTGPGDFSGLTGAVEVKARKTAVGDGACGTIYYETAAQTGGKGKLVLPGGGTALTNGRGSEINEGGPYDFDEIVATNYACLGVGPGVVVKTKKFLGGGILTDQVINTGNSKGKIELRGGEFRLSAGDVLTNVYVRVLADGSKLACGDDGDLTIGKNCMIGTLTSTLVVDGDFTMQAGSIFEHPYNGSTDQGYGVKLRVDGDMTVDAGATVTGTERGFKGAGPGRVSGCGSSHGGLAKGNPVTAVYGSIKCPTTLGSDCAVSPRYAGGRVRVSVGGALTMNGKVEVTGGWYNGGSYSPSGGSVWIDAGTLAGGGSITACGGRSNYNIGPGGGGRVAVYLTEDNATFDAFEQAGGEIAAPGGLTQTAAAEISYKPIGPCGTVYLSRTVNGVTNDVLVIANRDSDLRDYGACIGPNVTDTEVGSVVFKTNGVLRIAQDGILKVRRDFVRDPLRKDKFTSDAGDADHAAGTVEFTDADTVATVQGTNDFARLLVATPGKTVKFGTADEATCTKVGVFEITGDETAKVNLRSTQDGVRWPLTVYGSAAVNFADVMDSDASVDGGLKISAKDSTDGGNNENWKFSSIVVGETITWTGLSDSNWSNVDNWDKQREPVDTDVVEIPQDVVNMPQLSAAVTLNSLNIQTGARLTLAGYYLTVTNELRVAGSLVCTAAEVITAAGPVVDFGSGSFTCANSTFVLSGSLGQAFDPGSQVFYLMNFVKAGGTLTLADGFEAYQFYVTPSAAFAVLFAAGETIKASDCYVSAGSDVPLVSFASTDPGTRWNLEVTRQGLIRGVTLSDCAATGIELNDDLPGVDGGNNSRWRFGGTFRQWTGAGDGDFANPANWADNVAPDATSLVYFDGDATVKMSAPHTVRELQVASGSVEFAKGTNVLTVAESCSVENGAVLSLTTPCVVSNNVLIRTGGTLTHAAITSEPGALTNRLDLTVCGDLTVEQNAAIDVSEKGFTSTCNGGFGKASAAGSSHGGIGSAGRPAYDSVFAPIHPGSSASSGDPGNNGGGAVRLRVGGTLALNGRIVANGGNGNWYCGTGGSIWITAGRLVGGGSVSANSGNYLVASTSVSSGGRIAVCLTEGDFTDWTGTMTAYATIGDHDRPDGAAGTIYLQSAAEDDKCGTVYVTGRNETSPLPSTVHTPFPAVGWDLPEDFAGVKFVISGRAAVGFSSDMKIEDVVMTKTGTGQFAGEPKAYMFDHTVKVTSYAHHLRASQDLCDGWTIPYSTAVAPGENGQGRFLWKVHGLKLILR